MRFFPWSAVSAPTLHFLCFSSAVEQDAQGILKLVRKLEGCFSDFLVRRHPLSGAY